MPALSGQVVSTIRDASGNIIVQVTENYDPATNLMRNVDVVTTDGTRNGAVVVDNQLSRTVKIDVVQGGTVVRSFNIPSHGAAVTAAQLAGQGVTTIDQLNGVTINLS